MSDNIFKRRRDFIASYMEDNSFLILFSGEKIRKSSDQFYKFTPNKNFMYLTGLRNDNLIFLMKKEKDTYKTIIFIENRSKDLVKWIGNTVTEEECNSISDIEDVRFLDSFDSFMNNEISKFENVVIYLDLDRYDKKSALSINEMYAKEMNSKYPNIVIRSFYRKFCDSRLVKDEYEINEIRKAIRITKMGIENMMKNIKPGMTEFNLEAYFDFMVKYNGSTGISFETIIAAGKNATILHYIDKNSVINDGDLVLCDLGAESNFYKADITRTIPANGKFSPRQRQIYDVVLNTQLKVIGSVKPGITQAELNKIAEQSLYDGLKYIGKIDNMSQVKDYYYHSIGHSLGLDTHDIGGRDLTYKPGMIVTIEPGLYIEEENIGIRIEDDILVTEDGAEVLSKDIIKNADDIEKFIKENRG